MNVCVYTCVHIKVKNWELIKEIISYVTKQLNDDSVKKDFQNDVESIYN